MITERSSMTTVLSVRVNDDLVQNLDYLVKATDRSRAYIANEALQEYIARNAWQAKELQAAIVEADKGVFVSHKAVSDWVMSMGTDKELKRPKPDVFKR
jgi:RHH-type transcriptional regulator, rel operon repressor / antitoxin RelB